MTPGEQAFHKLLKTWISLRKADDAPVGVMVRTTERERWAAWRAYFEQHDCPIELRRMDLAESGRPFSVEPGTFVPWIQVPSNWPREFDPSASPTYREASGGTAEPAYFAPDRSPTAASPEQRERAVAQWERDLRPHIAPPHMQPRISDEKTRQAALARLDELHGQPLPKLSPEALATPKR